MVPGLLLWAAHPRKTAQGDRDVLADSLHKSTGEAFIGRRKSGQTQEPATAIAPTSKYLLLVGFSKDHDPKL